jgi:hypothetical protein
MHDRLGVFVNTRDFYHISIDIPDSIRFFQSSICLVLVVSGHDISSFALVIFHLLEVQPPMQPLLVFIFLDFI